jgi:hypothetical protein
LSYILLKIEQLISLIENGIGAEVL